MELYCALYSASSKLMHVAVLFWYSLLYTIALYGCTISVSGHLTLLPTFCYYEQYPCTHLVSVPKCSIQEFLSCVCLEVELMGFRVGFVLD